MTTYLTGALAAIIADPDCCAVSKAIARAALNGVSFDYCIVPSEPTFEMKLAGATAITKEMMEAMANYDAAAACWDAMVVTAQVLGERNSPTECPASHDGRHHLDTSMESGPNNCFHCEADLR